MKKMVVYNFLNREEGLLLLSETFGVELITVDDDDLDSNVEDLFNKTFEPSDRELSLGIDFVIFSDFDRTEMRNLMSAMQKSGFKTPYKCVLTSTNRNWKLRDLINEIIKEHEFIENMKKSKKN